MACRLFCYQYRRFPALSSERVLMITDRDRSKLYFRSQHPLSRLDVRQADRIAGRSGRRQRQRPRLSLSHMFIAAPENQVPTRPTGLQHRLLPSDHDGSPEVNRDSIPGYRSQMLLVGDPGSSDGCRKGSCPRDAAGDAAGSIHHVDNVHKQTSSLTRRVPRGGRNLEAASGIRWGLRRCHRRPARESPCHRQ